MTVWIRGVKASFCAGSQRSLFSRLREIEEQLHELKASTISKPPALKFKVCMFQGFLLNVPRAVKIHPQYEEFYFPPTPRHVPRHDVGRIILMYWLKCV